MGASLTAAACSRAAVIVALLSRSSALDCRWAYVLLAEKTSLAARPSSFRNMEFEKHRCERRISHTSSPHILVRKKTASQRWWGGGWPPCEEGNNFLLNTLQTIWACRKA